MMSGRYNIRYGFQSGVLKPLKPYGLPLNETLLPEVLKAQTTIREAHAVGKWHLGYYKYDYTPTYRGFDSFYGYFTAAAAAVPLVQRVLQRRVAVRTPRGCRGLLLRR